MNYSQIGGEFGNNSDFGRRVRIALTIAAVNVMSEVNTTTNHAARVTFATKVLQGQADFESAILAVFSNGTLASASAAANIIDSDLQFAMNSLFNALAGIGT